jgi:ferredoxin-NADP reductase
MVSHMDFHVRVLEVFARGDYAFSVRFERPPEFLFLPGQYVTITTSAGTASLTKPLSLASSPSEIFLEVAKSSTGHPFAKLLRNLIPGDEIVIRGPFGDFTFRGEYSKVAFIAGGIGITPLWSMIVNATEMLYDSDIRLLYSAKTQENILFRERMTDIAKDNPHLSIVITLTGSSPGWNGHKGRINRRMIEQEIPDWRDRVFFTSGPPLMVNSILAILREMGVTDDHNRYEYFAGY